MQRPVIFGLNGPQGSGKTTATGEAVRILASDAGICGITVSIDDFYLTHAEQLHLAAAHTDNPFLQQRGYPGTHDIRLGTEVLHSLKSINKDKVPVAIPRYDKSSHEGEGDRLNKSDWPVVAPPLDFAILEGWCVGFTAVSESAVRDAHLAEVNTMLKNYRVWYDFLDAFIQLKAEDINDTVRWRIEAEQKMRAQGKPAMSDERIRAYIERFLPAYELYLPGLGENPPVAKPRLVIGIRTDRSVTSVLTY